MRIDISTNPVSINLIDDVRATHKRLDIPLTGTAIIQNDRQNFLSVPCLATHVFHYEPPIALPLIACTRYRYKMEMRFIDRATLTGVRRLEDSGYLVAEVPVARTGLQDYAGYEVGRPDLAKVTVYRPPETVFDEASMRTAAHKPITDDHPSEGVSSKNWESLAKGWTGETIRKDEAAGLLYVPMMLTADSLIDKLEAGKREVSCGYTCELVFGDGVTPDGAPFQAMQKNIKFNHVAVVDRGRAGNVCRVGDSWQPITSDKEPFVATKTITIKNVADGLPFEVTDAAEAVINKLVEQRDAALERAAKSERDLNDARTETETEKGKVAALETKVADAEVTPAKLSKLVADRAALVAQAKAIHDADYAADSNAEIMKKAVAAKLGGGAAQMSDAAIEGAFAALANAKPITDSFREVVKDGLKQVEKYDPAADAAKRRSAISDAWNKPYGQKD